MHLSVSHRSGRRRRTRFTSSTSKAPALLALRSGLERLDFASGAAIAFAAAPFDPSLFRFNEVGAIQTVASGSASRSTQPTRPARPEAAAKLMPFGLLGFDSDNDSVFLNATVRDYCKAGGIAFTRCRPYRKSDQVWVEQKNGAVVRHTVGYRRLEGLEAAAAPARLYGSLRLFVNHFQPSFKLAEKSRDGARVRKRYMRRRRSISGCWPIRGRLPRYGAGWRQCTARWTRCGCCARFVLPSSSWWRDGEVRPTARAQAKAKRGRRRPDPLVAETALLRGSHDAEPWRTGRELLERIQREQPGIYADGLLRTLQRRLKIWRREMAHTLVFGTALANLGAGAVAMPEVASVV